MTKLKVNIIKHNNEDNLFDYNEFEIYEQLLKEDNFFENDKYYKNIFYGGANNNEIEDADSDDEAETEDEQEDEREDEQEDEREDEQEEKNNYISNKFNELLSLGNEEKNETKKDKSIQYTDEITKLKKENIDLKEKINKTTKKMSTEEENYLKKLFNDLLKTFDGEPTDKSILENLFKLFLQYLHGNIYFKELKNKP